MKKRLTLLFLSALLVLAIAFAQVEETRVSEKVSVTNVEVPVRVFFKGKAIDHLTRGDFKLYEDKKEQTINGFYVKRRKINTQNIALTTQGQQVEQAPERYFVLVFRLTNYNQHIRDGVEHLFTQVLAGKDRLLVFINDRTLFLDKELMDVDRRGLVEQVLKDEGVKAQHRLSAYFARIQRELNLTKMEIKMERESDEGRILPVASRPDNLIKFLKKYLSTWIEYKKKYLLPDIDNYYNFANFLEKIALEKWVINFYQIEQFPRLKATGELRRQIEQIINELMAARSEAVVYSRMMMDLLTEIDKELNVASDFPSEEISKLFYKIDATCHSVFCSVQKDALSQDLEFKKISTDIENSLRDITANTGGALITSDDLESALHTIGEKEDVYYMLTYEPDNPEKRGKIKIEVNDKKYKVFYDSNMRADYIKEYLAKKQAQNPTVELNDVAFAGTKLSMEINNFLMRKTANGKRGRLDVRVRVLDRENQVLYDRSRLLETKKKITHVSIGFDWLKNGEYNILVDVTDLLTGKTAMEFLQPRVEIF